MAAGCEPSYWSASRGDAEIDFLVQGERSVYPIEVKAAYNLKAKSLATYRDLFSPPVSYRVSLAQRTDGTSVRDVPLYDVARVADEIGADVEGVSHVT